MFISRASELEGSNNPACSAWTFPVKQWGAEPGSCLPAGCSHKFRIACLELLAFRPSAERRV